MDPISQPDKAPDADRAHPLVSIGLPVFNGMPYLETALDSLLAQDESDIEVIISDNASWDATEDHCRAVAAHDTRVRYSRTR